MADNRQGRPQRCATCTPACLVDDDGRRTSRRQTWPLSPATVAQATRNKHTRTTAAADRRGRERPAAVRP